MKITLGLEEIKYALCVHIFSKTGARLETDDVFISDIELNRESTDNSVSALKIVLEIDSK